MKRQAREERKERKERLAQDRVKINTTFTTMSAELNLPSNLRLTSQTLNWERVTIGESKAHVYRTEKFVLKIQPLKTTNDDVTLADEKSKIEWLKDKVRVPEIVDYLIDDAVEYLIMTRLPGINAAETTLKRDPKSLDTLLGRALRELHERVTIDNCPFDMRLDRLLNQTKESHGLIAELIRNKPEDDLVFTHGDYCLPNVIIDEQQSCVTGFVDLGRAGIADRYVDLALCLRSINYNLGERCEDALLEAYGCISSWDRQKIEFYQKLDEL